jgi:predicted lysophospholipase L1 biosynthesis ABC-type transport system permease subunit
LVGGGTMERKRSSRRYAARQKTLGAKCKDYLRQFIAFMFSNVGIIGLVVGYTIAGAFVFQAIEGQQASLPFLSFSESLRFSKTL